MDIGEVVRAMKADPTKRFARRGWNGKNMYIQLQVPDEHSKMTLPYVYMKTAQGDLVPWLCSQSDLVSEDYSEVEGTEQESKVKTSGLTINEALDAVTKDPSQVYMREGEADAYLMYNTEYGEALFKKGKPPLSVDDGRRLINVVADGTLDIEDMASSDWFLTGWSMCRPKGE